uniref:Putative hydroxypyruvate isomerase n=1 Tax=Anopheles farauti TaxID=69004 RepID=A0A182QS99_9DIPT
MIALKFCANLNFMFLEAGSFLDRYRAAKAAGFEAVEGPCPPPEVTPEALAAVLKETGLKQILLNIALGDQPEGKFGCAALPGWETEYVANLERTVEYAKALGCGKIHIMAGTPNGTPNAANDRTYLANLQAAAPILGRNNIVGVIEPICTYGVPGYYLSCYKKAVQMITDVGSPNVRLMFDVYHAQHIRGDITNGIRALAPYIGHVQIAQVPGRNEPSSDGELNFRYILHVLATEGRYTDGWVGCEYKPLAGTAQGLGWLRDFGYWQ